MLGNVLIGVAAGAVGTVALNGVTYGDMVVRGRGSSSVPAEMAGKLANKVGIDLSGKGEGPDGATAQNRKSGLGALQGYVVGLGIGAAYGLLRQRPREVRTMRDGVVLGLAAMAASDVPTAALGVSDPRTWGANAWLSDLVPHLAYGVTTAVAYEAFAERPGARRP